MEERERILAERRTWYNFRFVQFELVKCLKHRELCFLSPKSEEIKHPVRYLLAFSVEYLLKHFQRFDFLKNPLNIYHSVATLENVPVFSYNLAERRKDEKYKEFNQNYANYVVGYNIFFDFDGHEDFAKCLEEVKEAKKILDEYKLPYYILNSSFQGFHIHIPTEYLPKIEISQLIKTLNKVIYNFKGVYAFATLDNSIVDIKRVCAIPYGIKCDGSICLPLTDEQLEHFTPEMVSMASVLKNVIIKERGLLTRNLELGEEKLKANVSKFIKDFDTEA